MQHCKRRGAFTFYAPYHHNTLIKQWKMLTSWYPSIHGIIRNKGYLRWHHLFLPINSLAGTIFANEEVWYWLVTGNEPSFLHISAFHLFLLNKRNPWKVFILQVMIRVLSYYYGISCLAKFLSCIKLNCSNMVNHFIIPLIYISIYEGRIV